MYGPVLQRSGVRRGGPSLGELTGVGGGMREEERGEGAMFGVGVVEEWSRRGEPLWTRRKVANISYDKGGVCRREPERSERAVRGQT